MSEHCGCAESVVADQIDGLEQKLTDLRTDSLAAAQNFVDAYPEAIFRPIAKEQWPQIAAVLERLGISLDRVSASTMKHAATCIRDAIKAAIERSCQ